MIDKTYFKNIFRHLRTIQTHRKWVRHYCFIFGLYKQGLLHDLSKYSPTEFWESVKYYQGTSSPIDACKKANGYSMAWFHHRGRNPHHYVYWCDNFDEGMTTNLMPYNYFVEMFCDFLAAGHAYMGKNFTFNAEYDWWKKKREHCAMDARQIKMLDFIFITLAKDEKLWGTKIVEKKMKYTKNFLLKVTYDHYSKQEV